MAPKCLSVSVKVSPGELIDKLTILELKLENITDPVKLDNVRREYDALNQIRERDITPSTKLEQLTREIRSVNRHIWVIEDDIRMCENNHLFDAKFIELARSVYFKNDLRARLKREINELLGAEFYEEKSYQPYTHPDREN